MAVTQQPPLRDAPPPGEEVELVPSPDWEPRYRGSGRLVGKVAIVTGGDSGIGRAVAALFAREGARIAIVYLDEHDDARATATIIEREGSACLMLPGDIGDREFCRKIVSQVTEKWGRLDILVNNAGEQHPAKDLRDIDAEQLLRTFQTNVFGMYWLTAAALDALEEGSAIINCTSVVSYKGSEELIDYAGTKGAITAFTRSLSVNLAERGIRVNAVAPGPIWTPLNPMGGASEDKMKNFGEDTPLGRAGQPWEVAPSFLFLACDDSSYMTGQVLHPNGGIIVGG